VEFRCFVLGRKIQTASVYLREGQLAQDDEGRFYADESETLAATAFLREVLDDSAIQIPPAVVIDVGVIRGHGWAVIEANAAWGSGVYGCDPGLILPVLRRACVPSDQLTPEDAPWTFAGV
jgi:hypothetical protein